MRLENVYTGFTIRIVDGIAKIYADSEELVKAFGCDTIRELAEDLLKAVEETERDMEI